MNNDPLPHPMRELLPYTPVWQLNANLLLLVAIVLICAVGFWLWWRRRQKQQAKVSATVTSAPTTFEDLLRQLTQLQQMVTAAQNDAGELTSSFQTKEQWRHHYQQLDRILRQAIDLRQTIKAAGSPSSRQKVTLSQAMTNPELRNWIASFPGITAKQKANCQDYLDHSDLIQFAHQTSDAALCLTEIQLLRSVVEKLKPSANYPYPTDQVFNDKSSNHPGASTETKSASPWQPKVSKP